MGSPAVNSSLNANYWPLTLPGRPTDVIVPTAVNVLATAPLSTSQLTIHRSRPHVGYVFGFSVAAGGVLTPLPGSPYEAA